MRIVSPFARSMLLVQVGLSFTSSTVAHADPRAPSKALDLTCPSDLKTEVLSNLWERAPAAKPGPKASMVQVSYRNDYGQSARALLIAIDGVPAFLECEVPDGPGEVFLGLLEPGLHYVDVVFNFGPGRVGRAPHAVNVNQGKDSLLTIVIDRDDHEHPDAHFESKQASRARSK